jgi:hypothetical protein
MDLTDEGTPKPPATPPPPFAPQTLQVTPDNVVELGVLFSDAADRLEIEAGNLEYDLRLPNPWLGDPVSKRVWSFFNNYFVEDANSFANVVQAAYKQHVAHAEALAKAAELYGKADELKVKTDELRAARLKSQLPG